MCEEGVGIGVVRQAKIWFGLWLRYSRRFWGKRRRWCLGDLWSRRGWGRVRGMCEYIFDRRLRREERGW
jgi:hypothetical protein